MKAQMIALADLTLGDHACIVYDTETECRQTLIPYVRMGMEKGEKVVCIVRESQTKTLAQQLREAGLASVSTAAGGSLTIATAEQTYLSGGQFSGRRMMKLLEDSALQANAEGYAGLRVAGEMSWATTDDATQDLLLEYEAEVDSTIGQYRILALCQYSRQHFKQELLMRALPMHLVAVVDRRAYRVVRKV
jgi:hypothetical protein